MAQLNNIILFQHRSFGFIFWRKLHLLRHFDGSLFLGYDSNLFYYRGCLKWQDAPNPCRPVFRIIDNLLCSGRCVSSSPHTSQGHLRIDYVDKSGKATRRGIRVEEVYVYDDGVFVLRAWRLLRKGYRTTVRTHLKGCSDAFSK